LIAPDKKGYNLSMSKKGINTGGGVFGGKYRETYPQMLFNHLAAGYSFRTFSAVIRVNPATVYEWLDKHVEFAEAKAIGERASERFFEQKAIEQIEDGSAATLKLIMTNRFDYKDKSEISADADMKTLLATKPLINVVFKSGDETKDTE